MAGGGADSDEAQKLTTLAEIADLGVEDRIAANQAAREGSLSLSFADNNQDDEQSPGIDNSVGVNDFLDKSVGDVEVEQVHVEVEQGGGHEENTADIARNLLRYGVEDVSTLSDDQRDALRQQQCEVKRIEQEEDGALLEFLKENPPSDLSNDTSRDANTVSDDTDAASMTPSLNRPLTWEEKEAIRVSDAEFAAQLANQQDASVDAFFSLGGAAHEQSQYTAFFDRPTASSFENEALNGHDAFPEYRASDFESQVESSPENDKLDDISKVNQFAADTKEIHQEYDSFPRLPASHQPTPESKSRTSIFGTLASSLFGSPLAPAPETDEEEYNVMDNSDETTTEKESRGVYFSAEEENIVVEGFMCPICMIDCGSDVYLVEHFQTVHADDTTMSSGGDTGSAQPPTESDSNQDETNESNHKSTIEAGIADSDDATTAWKNARVDSMGKSSTESVEGNSQKDEVQNQPNNVGKDNAVQAKEHPFDKMPGGRVMYCERCFVRKIHIEDAYCLNCGQPHTNRMLPSPVYLKMRVTAYGFGLGFKDRLVHKVQPGSTSEISGLRLGDVISEVNGIDVQQKPDIEILQRIKISTGTMYLTVQRLHLVQPVSEYKNREDDVTHDEEQIFDSKSEVNAYEGSSRLEFEDDTASEGEKSRSSVSLSGEDLQYLHSTTAPSPHDGDMDLNLEKLEESTDSAEKEDQVELQADISASLESVSPFVRKEVIDHGADVDGVSQGMRDSNYVKALRQRVTDCEVQLAQKDEEIASIKADRDRIAAELAAVLSGGDNINDKDDQFAESPVLESGTLGSLCKHLHKNIEATRSVAMPLTQFVDELPRRISSVVESKVELQEAAAEQARLSQEIDPEMLSGAEQLLLSRSNSRVVAASDAAELNDKSLAATVDHASCNIEMLQKTALLVEHHVVKLSGFLSNTPSLGKTPIP